jgi:hypothetical protein
MLNLNIKYISITLIFLGLAIVKTSAQNASNYILLTPTNVSFNIGTAAALEATTTITNSFKVTCRSRNGIYTVYLKISARSQSTNTPIPYNSLGVKLNAAPTGVSGNFNEIYLSTIDQLIIQGPGTSGTRVHDWTYNLLLKPLGYNIKPGSYNFTLLFTMTQP